MNNQARTVLCRLLFLLLSGGALALFPFSLAQNAPQLSSTRTPNGRIEISWPSSFASFQLESAPNLSANAWEVVLPSATLSNNRWSVTIEPLESRRFFRLLENGGTVTSIVLETSPEEGETGVAVTRETILRFVNPLPASAQLDSAHFYAEFGGRRLLARPELSSDRTMATLFYQENLPASARIRVTFDSSNIALPPLLAQEPEIFTVEFETAGTSALPGTGVVGYVYASEQTGGTNRPLKGATVTVDGAEETLRAVTDGSGKFHLYPSPSGRFFVHVDGRTAEGSQWPNGSYYPFVGKAWEAVAGRSNNLAGGNGEIYLPFIPGDALTTVNPTNATIISVSPSVIATNPAFAGVSITVPPNALLNENGVRGGKVGLAPVPRDRLPEPLPPGLNLPLVITIQTDGPQNFDAPVPVRFPNLPDPETGEALPPGAKTVLWSFNHDTGRWEAQGTATISADGQFAETDPGVGVRQPGWHGVAPGSPGAGPDDCEGPDCECLQEIRCEIPVPGKSPGQCIFECLGDVPGDIFGGKKKNKRTAFETGLRCIGGPDKCPRNPEDTLDQDRRDCMDRCTNPKSKYVTYIVPCEGFSYPCPERQGLRAMATDDLVPDRFEEQRRFWEVEGEYLVRLYGTPKILQTPSGDLPKLYAMFDAFSDRAEPGSPAGIHLSAAERAELIAFPRPGQFNQVEWTALIDRLDSLQGAPLPADVQAAEQQLDQLVTLLKQRGWKYRLDGLFQGLIRETQVNAPPLGSAEFPARAHYYYLKDHNGEFVRRGRLSSSGRFEGMILNPDAFYSVGYYDPETGRVAAAFFQARPNGQTTMIPTAEFEERDPLNPDTDQDGVIDLAETIVGTNPGNADSDGDGLRDGVELVQGSNPLDGVPMQVGPIARVATSASAIDVTAFDRVALVAEGTAGVSVFDTRNFFNPVRVAQVDTPGEATAVALDGVFGAVADGSKGVTLLDLSGLPTVTSAQVSLGAPAVAVAARAGLAYVGLQNGSVSVVELRTGQVLETLPVSAQPLSDLIALGDVLYVLSPPKLYAVAMDEGNLRVASTVDSPGISGFNVRRLRVTGGEGLLYTAQLAGFNAFSLEDPLQPKLLASQNTAQRGWKQIVPNGSGLGVAAVGTASNNDGDHDVYLHNLLPGGTNGLFITKIPTAGLAGALSIFNGLAYIADGTNGLLVVNYLAADTQGIAPEVELFASFPLSGSPQAGSAQPAWMAARVSDDVQVRNVEFYLDGQLLGSDGNFPFEISFVAPALSQSKTNFTVQARAFDTGGNSTWTSAYIIALVPDATAPRVRRVSPRAGANTLDRVGAYFSELVDLAKVNGSTFQVVSAGADGQLGTADDATVTGVTYSSAPDAFLVEARFANPLPDGLYQATIGTGITDLNNNALAAPFVWQFRVGPGVFWIGPDGGTWENPLNWSNGAVPGSNDVAYVEIPFAEGKVVVNNGTFRVAALHSLENIELSANGVLIVDDWNAHKDVTLNGGTIRGSTLNLRNGAVLRPARNFSSTLRQTTVNGNIAVAENCILSVAGGLALNGTCSLANNALLRFIETQTISSGQFEFTGANVSVDLSSGTTVTFASPVILRGRSGSISGSGTLVNEGRIAADMAGGHIQVRPAAFTHAGSAQVLNGGELTFGGRWAGTGTVAVQQGTFNLAGDFGPVTTPITKTADGSVRIIGTGDLQGTTLTLNAATGSWSLDGGTLQNGTLALTEGAVLRSARNFSSTLRGMVVNGNILVDENCILSVRGGLALNGICSLANNALLRFLETQTVTAGTFDFAGANVSVDIIQGVTVTFAPPVLLHGRSGSVSGSGTLLNQGRIVADIASGHIQVRPGSLSHTGSAEVLNGGELTFGGNWSGAGTVAVQKGTFNLAGQFGPLNTVITKSAEGVVRITGTGNLQGSTLTLNAGTGSWALDGGVIQNGTLTFTDGSALRSARNFSSALRGMTVNGNIVVDENCILSVQGGLTLNGICQLGNNGLLRFTETQTIAAGTFEFAGSNVSVDISSGTTVTFAPPVFLHGRSGSISGGGTWVNQGRIAADVDGGHIQVRPSIFTHSGGGEVTNGGELTFGGNWSGAGPIAVTQGRFNLAGQFGPITTPITKTADGSVRITGIGDLQGSTHTLNAATGSWVLDGGTIQNGTLTLADGMVLRPARNFSSVLRKMTVNGNIVVDENCILSVQGGLALNGICQLGNNALLRFTETQTIATGTFEFAGSNVSVDISSGTTATFAAPVLLHGRSGSIAGGGTWVNQGRIAADVAGGHIQVRPSTFTHSGSAEVLNGAELTFAGNWSGTGTIAVQQGTFNLGGQFGPLGTPITKSDAGTVRVTGTADLQGTTLTLNAATGSWALDGGAIQNGTLALTEGTVLRPARNFSSILRKMTVNGNIAVAENCILTIQGGLALNGTCSLANNALLRFTETQTITAGNFEFIGSNVSVDISSAATVTFGPALVLHGRSGTIGGGGTLANQGKISADVSGGTIRVNVANFTNTGVLEEINGGNLIAPGFQ